jgi:glutathione S-transferase
LWSDEPVVGARSLGYAGAVILYTCGTKTAGPGFAHPCAKAGNALDAAGYEYEIKTVPGYRLAVWTWSNRKRDREEINKLSGTDEVPILVLDDGEVVSGSGAIAKWAKEHPLSRAKSSPA